MELSLEIVGGSPRLALEMIGSGNSIHSGAEVSVPGGATLQYRGTLAKRSVGIPDVLQFILHSSVDIEISLVASWLFEHLKSRPAESVIINRRVVTEITENGIRQVLEDEVSL